MNIFIDNTGLHSAFRAIEGNAKGEADIKGLLQFLTYIVFSNKCLINGYEIPSIANRTKEVKEILVDWGLKEDSLEIVPFGKKKYFRHVENVAESASEDFSFYPIGKENYGMQPDIPQEFLDDKRLFHLILTQDFSEKDLNLTLEKASQDMSSNIGLYMLAKNSNLLKKAKQFVSQHSKWSVNKSSLLNKYLRTLHNDSLARSMGARYAPAFERAKLMRIGNEIIVKKVENIIDESVSKLKKTSLGLPVISQVLIELGKGEPKSTFMEALNMREKASRFHKRINEVADKLSSDFYEERFEAEKEIRDLSNDLQRTLGLQSEPRFLDALDLNFILGIPSPKLSTSKFVDWVKYRLKKREIAVLTNMSKVLIASSENSSVQIKFEKTCYRNIK